MFSYDSQTSPSAAEMAADVTSDPEAMPSDGRTRRRQRNIQAVRDAIIELLAEGTEPSMQIVAARARVAVRSIYRYYDDLADAVNDAIAHRYRVAFHNLLNQPVPAPGASRSERTTLMLKGRLELVELLNPIRHQPDSPELLDAMDREIGSLFRPELDGFESEDRIHLAAALTVLLRPASIRSLLTRLGTVEEVEATIRRAVDALLAPAG